MRGKPSCWCWYEALQRQHTACFSISLYNAVCAFVPAIPTLLLLAALIGDAAVLLLLRNCGDALYFSSYSTFTSTFVLASSPWKWARSTWNFDKMCSENELNLRGALFGCLTLTPKIHTRSSIITAGQLRQESQPAVSSSLLLCATSEVWRSQPWASWHLETINTSPSSTQT